MARHRTYLPETRDPTASRRNVTGPGETPLCRLDACYSAKRSRKPHAPEGIAPQAQRRGTRRDERRFTTATAPRSSRQIVGIIAPAEDQVVGFKREQKVRQICFGD